MTTKQIMLEFKTVNEKFLALEKKFNLLLNQLQKDNDEAINAIICSMLQEESKDENEIA